MGCQNQFADKTPFECGIKLDQFFKDTIEFLTFESCWSPQKGCYWGKWTCILVKGHCSKYFTFPILEFLASGVWIWLLKACKSFQAGPDDRRSHLLESDSKIGCGNKGELYNLEQAMAQYFLWFSPNNDRRQRRRKNTKMTLKHVFCKGVREILT